MAEPDSIPPIDPSAASAEDSSSSLDPPRRSRLFGGIGRATQHRTRVHRRRYLILFLVLVAVLSATSIQVVHRNEPAFLRLQRLYDKPWFLQRLDPTVDDEAALADELGVSVEELRRTDQVLQRLRFRAESATIGPLDWQVTLSLGAYFVIVRFQIVVNVIISALIAFLLYTWARDRASSRVIDEQNRQLRELSEENGRKFEEADRYLRELKQAQTKLVAAQKLASVGRMSATLAHEIRNPMTIIQSAAGMAAEDLTPGSAPHQAIEMIRGEIKRLDHIITELLNFARPKPSRLDTHDLNALIRNWSRPIGESLEAINIDLVFNLDEAIPAVVADSDHLYQVFLNLIWNARDAVRDTAGGTIEVTTEVAGPNGVFLIVRDDGVGMDKETLQQVYEPFYTTKVHGTGLGLPVVQQLMEGMGGSVMVESEVGLGTTVHLVLQAMRQVPVSSLDGPPTFDSVPPEILDSGYILPVALPDSASANAAQSLLSRKTE